MDGLCRVREQAVYANGFYKAATNLRKRVLWVGMELEIMCSCVVIMEFEMKKMSPIQFLTRMHFVVGCSNVSP